MKVRVFKQNNNHHGLEVITVEISDYCQQCGKKRGLPYDHQQYIDGATYSVNRWDNPCGHIDYYPEVIKEAQKKAGE